MKKKILLIIILLSTFTITTNSQFRRITLLEEATNASCGPCAANNPALQEFLSRNFGGVIAVMYHASWPGTDPMYSLNKDVNTDRINYYEIEGVPNYCLDGTLYGVPSNPVEIEEQMRERLELGSPVNIFINSQINETDVNVDITIEAGAAVVQGNLKLRVAIIERMVTYNTPPGRNGEKIFPNVMREMLPDAAGTAIAAINNGDVMNYNFNVPIKEEWNSDDLAVVAWIQSDATKEIIQSNINIPTAVIETEAVTAELLDYNQTYTKEFFITNTNEVPYPAAISLNDVILADGWTCQIIYKGNSSQELKTSIDPGQTLEFSVEIKTGSNAGSYTADLTVFNEDDPYKFGPSVNFFGIILSVGDLLFVDSDGGNNFELQYFEAFDSAGVEYSFIPAQHVVPFLSGKGNDYKSIFWNVSWTFPCITKENILFLKNFMDNGGDLFIAGQDIGWDMFDPGGYTTYPEAVDFYNNYLDANYIGDDTETYTVEGVPGIALMDNFSTTIDRTVHDSNCYPEDIKSFRNIGTEALKYLNKTKYAAIAYDNGNYKSFYMGVELEQFKTAEARNDLIRRVLDWFDIIVGIDDNDFDGMPFEFVLNRNYPNPFNPSTTINYQIPVKSHVSLKIYDILGHEVRTLVNEEKEAGRHVVEFKADGLASGVYFYKLTSNSNTAVKKMSLIK